MDFFTFLGYFIMTDIALTAIVLGLTYVFNRNRYEMMIYNLKSLLGIKQHVDFTEEDGDFDLEEEESIEPPKPRMKRALDKVFNIKNK